MTIFRKLIASLSGLFLVFFLLGHLLGNLQLIILPDNLVQKQFNEYAFFMTTNPIVKLLSFLTYASILVHVLITIFLTLSSRKLRNISYAVSSKNKSSTWISRNMPLLGIIVLLFILIHMRSFWYEMHFGNISLDPWGNKDLFTITTSAFKSLWYTLFYVISIIFIGMHLFHGIESGFQTLGLKNRRFDLLIKRFSKTISIIITLGFAIIPIIIYTT